MAIAQKLRLRREYPKEGTAHVAEAHENERVEGGQRRIRLEEGGALLIPESLNTRTAAPA